jgi:hypothetical protein
MKNLSGMKNSATRYLAPETATGDKGIPIP